MVIRESRVDRLACDAGIAIRKAFDRKSAIFLKWLRDSLTPAERRTMTLHVMAVGSRRMFELTGNADIDSVLKKLRGNQKMMEVYAELVKLDGLLARVERTRTRRRK